MAICGINAGRLESGRRFTAAVLGPVQLGKRHTSNSWVSWPALPWQHIDTRPGLCFVVPCAGILCPSNQHFTEAPIALQLELQRHLALPTLSPAQ